MRAYLTSFCGSSAFITYLNFSRSNSTPVFGHYIPHHFNLRRSEYVFPLFYFQAALLSAIKNNEGIVDIFRHALGAEGNNVSADSHKLRSLTKIFDIT